MPPQAAPAPAEVDGERVIVRIVCTVPTDPRARINLHQNFDPVPKGCIGDHVTVPMLPGSAFTMTVNGVRTKFHGVRKKLAGIRREVVVEATMGKSPTVGCCLRSICSDNPAYVQTDEVLIPVLNARTVTVTVDGRRLGTERATENHGPK